MLGIIRKLSGVSAPSSDEDDGWTGLFARLYIILCVFGEAILQRKLPTRAWRATYFKKLPRLFVLQDGSWREMRDYLLYSQPQIDSWDRYEAYPRHNSLAFPTC